MSYKIDIKGKIYGKWTVNYFSHNAKKSGNAYWNCTCSCGNIRLVDGVKLREGSSSKCHSCSGKDNGRIGIYRQSEGKTVYFIRCGDYVKIGASSNPQRRLKDMETNNPQELKLIATDNEKNEEYYHEEFKHRHHRGEWYHFPSVHI